MKNNSLKSIAEKLHHARSILIFPHMQMDGDALGSSVALCIAMRRLGKKAYILIEEDIPLNLAFLDNGYCTKETKFTDVADVCLAVDCSDIDRINKRKDTFLSGDIRICIDHHVTGEHFADLNYIDYKASATAEIIYSLLKEMGQVVDSLIAEALFAAITTDTGNFQYTNTTKQTHLLVAELYDTGMDNNKVTVQIYQNNRPEKVKITGMILSRMELFCDGRVNIAYVTQDMLRDSGASMDETEGIVEQLRNIKGVEISVFLKEEIDRIKVGMRAKMNADVSQIAHTFGGGGHKKAAGCTINATLESAKEQIIEEIQKHLIGLKG